MNKVLLLAYFMANAVTCIKGKSNKITNRFVTLTNSRKFEYLIVFICVYDTFPKLFRICEVSYIFKNSMEIVSSIVPIIVS